MALGSKLAPFFGAAGAAGAGGYEIERSLRFNSSDSASLTKTFNATGSQTTYAFSFWLKKTNNSSIYQNILIDNDSSSSQIRINDTTGGFELRFAAAGASAALTTNRKFRDPSAWYHIVCVYDSTNATSSNRMRIYVNGVRETSFLGETQPTQNLASAFITNGHTYTLGYFAANTAIDGYLAEVNYLDGLTPGTATDDANGSVTGIPNAQYLTDFGEFDATTGVWNPIEYTGSYGTNGFHLDFADNSSAAALGYDAAGSNDWTVNNLSVTAGAGNDSLRDSPTNGDPANDTGLGGEVPGNYCTWNPIASNSIYFATLSNGNLDAAASGNARIAFGTIAIPSSGKWYFEVTTTGSPSYPYIGVASYGDTSTAYPQDNIFPSVTYYGTDGTKDVDGTYSAYGATYSNATIGVAVNVDSSQVTFYKDGVSQGAISKAVVGAFPFVSTAGGSGTFIANFGQRAFAYSAPSGFKALCTANLPTPTIADGSTAMDVALYTGNGTSVTVADLAFSPDFVWLKGRSDPDRHGLYDTVRGATKRLQSSETNAEDTQNGVTAFNSDGFVVGNYAETNGSGRTYVGWTWDAGTSNATNTSGTITSTVRANISAGFSIVTLSYSELSGAVTVGHGLGVAPKMIIVKRRNTTGNWYVAHTGLTNMSGYYLLLESTAAQGAASWGSAPTSTVFGMSDNIFGTGDYVAYCFAPVAGYSAFGSYTGNGSATDGPFVYTGFRPRWVMIKGYVGGQGSSSQWLIIDTSRDTYNVAGNKLAANLSDLENSANVGTVTQNTLDILSNGFKPRTSNGSSNDGTTSYVWAAFAENPFKYTRAR